MSLCYFFSLVLTDKRLGRDDQAEVESLAFLLEIFDADGSQPIGRSLNKS